MKFLRTTLFIIVLGLMAFSSASAQQAIAPPPKPADSGPSLAVTMKFIQDRLNSIGNVRFIAFVQNTADGGTFSNAYTNEVSNVVADQKQCRISDHWKATRDGSTLRDLDAWFSLRDVQDIVIKPYERAQTEATASAGDLKIVTTSTNPSVTALVVRRPRDGAIFFHSLTPILPTA
jgi:hypothetical protein